MEGWMINLAIAVGGIVFGYGMFKGKIQAAEDRAADHEETDKQFHSDLERRMSDQFKRIDSVSIECASIRAEMQQAISMEQAEEKFVSKTEMLLHLRNLELTVENTNGKIDRVDAYVEKFEGKLEDILNILSERKQ